MMTLTDARGPQFSRRDLSRLLALAPLLSAIPVSAARHPAGPVIGFHDDAPWLDQTGRDHPYRPPAGIAPRAPDSESLMRLGHFL